MAPVACERHNGRVEHRIEPPEVGQRFCKIASAREISDELKSGTLSAGMNPLRYATDLRRFNLRPPPCERRAARKLFQSETRGAIFRIVDSRQLTTFPSVSAGAKIPQ